MFRIFEGDTANQVWENIALTLNEGDSVSAQWSRTGSMREILHAGISMANPLQRWVVSRQPAINPAFAIAEVIWIMTGRNDAGFLNYFNRDLPKYAGNDATYHGAYGYRLRHYFRIDQLERAYKTLKVNPESRQVVLQIWDPSIDLPDEIGRPQNRDIPCSVLAALKLRNGRLEWLQVIRSNDLFRGVPYNFIQFTSIHEILAGWLHVNVGSYNQFSDSLHVYNEDYKKIKEFKPVVPATNTDFLSVDRKESEEAFKELARRTVLFIEEGLSKSEHLKLASWSEAPKAFQNMLCVLAAEAARRRSWIEEACIIMTRCDNPALLQVWNRWFERVEKLATLKV